MPIGKEQKWLLELPSIFTLGLQYPDIDMDFEKSEIRKIYSLFVPKLSLSSFYKLSVQESSDIYIFRGMIVYYGRHYWAYFYSQKFDCWF